MKALAIALLALPLTALAQSPEAIARLYHQEPNFGFYNGNAQYAAPVIVVPQYAPNNLQQQQNLRLQNEVITNLQLKNQALQADAYKSFGADSLAETNRKMFDIK